ncbi:GntR family transcriptional regulator [Desertivirga arenae]|uniref:GntR family transcriptional regulator n=1 Tax=Desertivirga arenae TaxID=2810309 RepID=UPI001A969267|nr:GntR family transcriptional regulator [Pedobacter sp. SYSU D00823]
MNYISSDSFNKKLWKRENAKNNTLKRFKWINSLSLQLNKKKRLQPQIILFIENLICKNELQPGDQVPPIKPFADALGIQHNTVAKVYRNLECNGFLESKPHQGTYVKGCTEKCIKDLQTYLQQKPAFFFKTKGKGRPPVIDRGKAWLELGNFFPCADDLLDGKYMTACGDAVRFYSTKFAANKTRTASLNATLMRLIESRSMRVNESQFLFTRHGKATISEILRTLLSETDTAVLASPADSHYYQALSMITSHISFTGSDREGMSIVQLERICRKKNIKLVLIRSSADYERGVPLSKQRRELLLKLADQYNFVVMEIDDYPDSFYGKFNFPLLGKAKSARVIYVSSVSVTLNKLENFRLVIAPSAFITHLKHFQESMETATDKIMEHALHTILSSSAQHEQLKKLNSKSKKAMGDIIEITKFHSESFEASYPALAGFGLWIEFRYPMRRELVDQVFASYEISTSAKGNIRESNLTGLKIGFATGLPFNLEPALEMLAKKLQKEILTRKNHH